MTDQTTTDPCDRQVQHPAHRNWRSDEVGICPGRKATTATPSTSRKES